MLQRLTVARARKLIFAALTGAGTVPRNAGYFTEAILDTELSGLEGHGFYWLQYYCEHVQSGKVDGKAKPTVKMLSPVSMHVDAKRGFAHPAIEAGFEKLVPAAKKFGMAAMAVHGSYNAATLGFHTGVSGEQRLAGFWLHQFRSGHCACGRIEAGDRHQSDVVGGAGPKGQNCFSDRSIILRRGRGQR